MATPITSTAAANTNTKDDEDLEIARRSRRVALRALNLNSNKGQGGGSAGAGVGVGGIGMGEPPTPTQNPLDSSLKRHTALIKRIRQSLGVDNRDLILKDIHSLSLEKYVDEIAQAVVEGVVGRCKSEKDVWSAVEIISSIHRRFPNTFTPTLLTHFSNHLSPPPRPSISSSIADPKEKDKEDSARIARQRPVLRVCAELALVGIIRDKEREKGGERPADGKGRSGGEWTMKVLKDLLSNDPTLSSLPLLSTFLKSYARPYLGLTSPTANKSQIPKLSEPGTLASALTAVEQEQEKGSLGSDTKTNGVSGKGVGNERGVKDEVLEEEELVEKEVRERFRKMCEGYFESVAKKLVIEHKRLQDQDRRNHEAYIRSGEIFEDRQQAYEKMTKNYEKLLASCQTLSELLYLPMPSLSTQSQKMDSIGVSSMTSSSNGQQDGQDDSFSSNNMSKWEDEEERRFFEDVQDLREFVPWGFLGLDSEGDKDKDKESKESKEKEENSVEVERRNMEAVEVKKLEEELNALKLSEMGGDEGGGITNGSGVVIIVDDQMRGEESSDKDNDDDDDGLPTPIPTPPRTPTPPLTPAIAPQGPSQLLTALLTRLPDATNRSMIDQIAVDFAFLNSKAARKRLIKFLNQVPRNRIDLLPHYSRLIATLNKYMPDIGSEVVAFLEDEFRYLQKKKNVKMELAESRQKNIAFISNLTKFGVVPSHVILHMYKVCIDDFSGVNVENLAMFLEGCGRFLLKNEETKERFATMLELTRRKQARAHLDQRQLLLLENAYYQCNPPDRPPRQEKERTPTEQFIRHIIYDVLSKKTIDKVLKLIRKLDWDDHHVVRILHSIFTKPWKVKYGNISLLAMLAYDLQRYHHAFAVAVVDQVLEDVRRGLEMNLYKANQQRVATMKYLGELYIYRLISSSIIFDTFWSLVTFGHPEGRPLPNQPCQIDMPDDFFRIRLVCTLLDATGMCFDRGSQAKKLDNFLTFFKLYIHTKQELPMDVDFMVSDSLEALRLKTNMYKDFEEAAHAVDEMFNSILGSPEVHDENDDSGDDSGDENDNTEPRQANEDDDDDNAGPESPTDVRPSSPDTLVVISTAEKLGPTEDDDTEFAKELAKMVTEAPGENKKVDRRTAQALWDTSLPSNIRKRKGDDSDDDDNISDTTASDGTEFMKFTVLTKKGNKQQTKKLAIPAASALAAHTRSAQLQDKVEQQQLKRLVLNYEQREEMEELRALENRTRNGAIKLRLAG